MLDWQNALRMHAARMDAQQSVARYGTVQSISANDCTVRVMLQPENTLSGWLPVLMPALGAGWGIVALPAIGQQVLILAEYGGVESGVVIGTAFSETTPPPKAAAQPGGTVQTTQSGEILLLSEKGAVLRLCSDGSIYIAANTIQMQGDLIVQGDVYDNHGSLNSLRTHYNQHVHSGVQTGSGITGVTSQQDGR